MPEQRVRCQVCDALNTPGEKFCEVCGVELKLEAKPGGEADVDSLLQELIETKTGAPSKKDSKPGALDIEEDIVDELLDSLVVDEATAQPAAPAVQEFECPICGATVQENAPECPQCHTPFAPAAGEAVPAVPEVEPVPEGEMGPPPGEEAAPEEEVPRVVPIPKEPEEEPIAVTVTEEDLSKLRVASGRYIDFVVIGTLAGLVATFAGFQMWSLDRVAANPASLGVFLAIMFTGLALGFVLFQLTTSAIGQGDRLVKAALYDDAIGYYDRALELRPRYAIAWNNKGAALAKSGKFPEARKCADRAVRLKPRYVAAWLNLGEVLARLGQRSEAEKCLERARSLTG